MNEQRTPDLDHLAETGQSISWSPEAPIDEELERFHRYRIKRVRRGRVAKAATLALALGLVGLLAIQLQESRESSIESSLVAEKTVKDSPRPGSAPIHFEDGSVARPMTASTQLVIQEVTPREVRVRLDRGKGEFQVTPDRTRGFVVETPSGTVTVLGTLFQVEHLAESDELSVRVKRGLVRVEVEDQSWELAAGDEGIFPPRPVVETEHAEALVFEEPPVEEEKSAPEESVTERTQVEPPRKKRATSRDWRSLAERGDFESASKELARTKHRVSDDVGELLLAADTMRLTRQPQKAIGFLDRIVKNHPGDARVPLATFTRGRILLQQLGRPREAAKSFARVQSLDPSGELVEDALAREVEALYKAGDASLARQRADEYLKKFPKGYRRRAVRRYGGFD